MIYTHVLKITAGGTASPLDALSAVSALSPPPGACNRPVAQENCAMIDA